VAVVGVGTIGSHVMPHVARMATVTSVTVIDRDCYDESNVSAQNILRDDVGESKAQVQARRIRQINPAISVRAFHEPVEDLPLGCLRADVILAGLDSRRARMAVNHAAWRLGVPWINAGVDGGGSLARVQVFMPSDEAPCLECAWDARDYDLVEQEYPCRGVAGAPQTGASSGLGALAASLQALECEKILSGDRTHSLEGRDVVVDARHHRHYVTRFRRNLECRMPDHAGWSIVPFDTDARSTTVASLIATTRTLDGADRGVHMAVAGQQFAIAVTCAQCRKRLPAGRLHRGELARGGGRCPSCGDALVAAGFDLLERVALHELPEPVRGQPLTALGLLPGDVLTFTTAEVEQHIELGGTAWAIES
jgi:molybdopterin/thiamine biosynthesis adenylyltransferase